MSLWKSLLYASQRLNAKGVRIFKLQLKAIDKAIQVEKFTAILFMKKIAGLGTGAMPCYVLCHWCGRGSKMAASYSKRHTRSEYIIIIYD